MRRILPHHFRRDGRAKQGLTKEEAKQAAIKTKMHYYHCEFCDKYHLARK